MSVCEVCYESVSGTCVCGQAGCEGRVSASDNPEIPELNERMNSSSSSGHKEPHLPYYSSRQKHITLTKFIGFS